MDKIDTKNIINNETDVDNTLISENESDLSVRLSEEEEDAWGEVIPESAPSSEEKPEDSGKSAIPPLEKPTEEDKKLRQESYKIMANVGNFGLFLLLAVLFGYFIGKTCDKFFGTKPVFTVIWIGFGVAASVLEVIKTVKAAKKMGEGEDSTPPIEK